MFAHEGGVSHCSVPYTQIMYTNQLHSWGRLYKPLGPTPETAFIKTCCATCLLPPSTLPLPQKNYVIETENEDL